MFFEMQLEIIAGTHRMKINHAPLTLTTFLDSYKKILPNNYKNNANLNI